jgi:hypothetical protein
MKLLLTSVCYAMAIGLAVSVSPAAAQNNDVQALCNNKHGLGKNWPTASEEQRKTAAAKIAACVRSGGKS